MKGSVLERYIQPKGDQRSDEADQECSADDLGAFGYLRGLHDRAMMLELRFKNGNIDAFPYVWLSRASFEPSEGIILRFGSEKITIRGQHLNGDVRSRARLFDGIVHHRVPWVQEADEPSAIQATKGATVIESLEIK